MSAHSFLDLPPSPPAMPAKLAEARRFAHYASLAFLLAAAVHGILYLAFLVQSIAWVAPGWFFAPSVLIHIVAIMGCFVCAGLVRSGVVTALDAGSTDRARSGALLAGALAVAWVVLGATLAIIPAILLAIVWHGLDSARQVLNSGPPSSEAYPPPPGQWPGA